MATRESYEKHKEASRNWAVEDSRKGRDISGGYPGPGNLVERAACERDLRRFCEVYFPAAFHLAWSDDHLKVLKRMEDVILEGGLFALAMPRGSGKSTLSMRAALWALLYGHRRFVCLIGSTEEKARMLLKDLKTEINYNDRLAADFRQVCYPIRRLENNGRRCIGQLFKGKETRIDWSEDRLTFPTMPDEACDGVNVSGFTVSVGGLTGALRGQNHTLVNGTIIRPEVAILDDPQTRESAMSSAQSVRRAEIIKGDVLGMAGPDQEVSAIMPCTVIRSGDMADEMLDRSKNPEWAGQLTKMVYSFPSNMKPWEEYRDIREKEFRDGSDHTTSDAFYTERREIMDAGAVLAWPERKGKAQSAVQHAMNLLFRDERAFHAEYQNEPLADAEARPDDLTPDQITAKLNRHPRGVVPLGSDHLTAFIDVQKSLLFYAVMSWEAGFTGNLLAYGTFPEQKRAYFTLRDAKTKIPNVIKASDLEGQLYGALDALTQLLLGREWVREDGAHLRIDRCLIDANWGDSTEIVYKFCRQSQFSANLTPSHGKYVGASNSPMREWPKRQGERVGHYWRLRTTGGRRAVRSVVFDSNFWKSFFANRLAVPMGSKSSISLFGDKPEAHQMLADHFCSEYRVRVEKKGSDRVVDEWKQRPDRPDNHFFDCAVGCCVAASMEGVVMDGDDAITRRKQVTYAEHLARKAASAANPAVAATPNAPKPARVRKQITYAEMMARNQGQQGEKKLPPWHSGI